MDTNLSTSYQLNIDLSFISFPLQDLDIFLDNDVQILLAI